MIVVDLGPVSSRNGRVIGRLCDGVYVLLGPTHCASQEWITQQLAWHDRDGSVVCGTLVANLLKAA